MHKIYIDAGHGGKDPGACANGLKEKDLTLAIVKGIKNELYTYEGVSCRFSRTTDKTVDLNKMCKAINEWGADIAVSVHINAGGGVGREALVAHGSSKATKLADCILDEIGSIVPTNRGIKTRLNSDGKTDYFAFNRIPNCPSPIIEYFFIDSSDSKYAKKTYALGKATGRAIAKYLGLKKKIAYKKYETCYRMNIRRSPAAIGGFVRRVPKGTVLKIASVDHNGWGKIYGGDFHNCYIRIKSPKKNYCELVD